MTDHKAIQANEQKRTRLIHEANKEATEYGHDMQPFDLYGLEHARSRCKICKRQACIECNPDGQSLQIYGAAVSGPCYGRMVKNVHRMEE